MHRFCIGIVVLVIAGCGPKVVMPVPVKGTVNLDGKPLPKGKIFFKATTGQVPEELVIEDGRFEGEVKPGEKRVEFAVYRPVRIPPEVPQHLHALMAGGKENYLPARYHRDSTLSENVRDAGDNEFHFELTSGK